MTLYITIILASIKLVAKRGKKEVYETMSGTGKKYITILACGFGDGMRLHLM